MIVRWRKLDALTWESEAWQGMVATVYYNQPGKDWRARLRAADPGFELSATGSSETDVRGAWSSHRAAIDAVDAAMERVVKTAMTKPVTARQRPASFSRLVVAHA